MTNAQLSVLAEAAREAVFQDRDFEWLAEEAYNAVMTTGKQFVKPLQPIEE